MYWSLGLLNIRLVLTAEFQKFQEQTFDHLRGEPGYNTSKRFSLHGQIFPSYRAQNSVFPPVEMNYLTDLTKQNVPQVFWTNIIFMTVYWTNYNNYCVVT